MSVFTLSLLILTLSWLAACSNKADPGREKLQGIWQQSPGMGAGWANRYHFYPSGTFHFYPNEMTCIEEKIEKIGTWKVKDSQLTLFTIKQIIKNYETGTNGFCHRLDTKQVLLSDAIVEQLALGEYGTREGEPYPSITLNGVQFWKFSDNATSYGDESFPE